MLSQISNDKTQEHKSVLKENAKEYGKDIGERAILQFVSFYCTTPFAGVILNKAPRELLLLLKTNDILRALSSALGGDPADIYWIMARRCVKAINLHRTSLAPSWHTYFTNTRDTIRVESFVITAQLALALSRMQS